MATTDRKRGTVDGGTGRGVRIGGKDAGRAPTGYDRQRSVGNDGIDDDETLPTVNDEGYDEFFENDDDDPGRRRDPLRRP